MPSQPQDSGDRAAVVHEDDGGISSLFQSNRTWAQGKVHSDPDFFQRLVAQQKPRYFWIGCADSRVPATEILGLDPGEVFVHRNVANLTIAEDPNFAAALEFAVSVLHVEHVIVVGHFRCGGIQAAMEPETQDAIGDWLKPVRALHQAHIHETDPNELCKLNVKAQVEALSVNPYITEAWEAGEKVSIHGLVYAIADGLLQRVCGPVTSGPWVAADNKK